MQVAGWGFVGMVMLFFARAYGVEIPTSILLKRIAIVFTAGILVTHLLRELIRWQGWMMRPVEKVIPLAFAHSGNAFQNSRILEDNG